MYEARLVRFDAGKAHLRAAFHALRIFVETFGLFLWHWPPHGRLRAPCKAKVPPWESCGNQPEFTLHTLEVFRSSTMRGEGAGHRLSHPARWQLLRNEKSF
jgi:hypothetical protein